MAAKQEFNAERDIYEKMKERENRKSMSPPEVLRDMGDHIAYFKINQALLVRQGRQAANREAFTELMSCMG